MISSPTWQPPPENLLLGYEDIHVWRAFLDLDVPYIQDLYATLSADEQERSARFHFQRDQNRFIVARGTLRAILGRYLNVHPRQLAFQYGPYGKPSLTSESSDGKLFFNLAHSQRLGLFAISYGREVGVDIEYVRNDLEDDKIAERFFSPREVATLKQVPPNRRKEAFFNCWTRKEAYIKARGEGLSLPLEKFDVSLVPGEPAMLMNTQDDELEAKRWSLAELMPGPGYVAAIAVRGHGWKLQCWQWNQ